MLLKQHLYIFPLFFTSRFTESHFQSGASQGFYYTNHNPSYHLLLYWEVPWFYLSLLHVALSSWTTTVFFLAVELTFRNSMVDPYITVCLNHISWSNKVYFTIYIVYLANALRPLCQSKSQYSVFMHLKSFDLQMLLT